MKSMGKFIVLTLTLGFRIDAQQPPIAFMDVAVVPMDKEQILSHQIVLVVSGRIAQVGPAASVKVPADAYRIDGRGKFLMPGLADMHVHLIRSALQKTPQPSPSATTCLASGERYRTVAGLRRERHCTSRPASASSENAQENRALGLLFVANGITTVRNMWGDPAIDTFAREVESGDVLGPHVYSTGPITDGNPPVWEGSRIVETKEQAQEAVRSDKQAGYIAVKVYDWLSKDAYNALVSAARSEGMPIVGHVPVEVTLREAIAARQDSIEHLTGFLEALQPEATVPDKPVAKLLEDADLSKLPALVQEIKTQNIWNCPTLVVNSMPRTDDRWLEERSFLPATLMSRYAKMYPARAAGTDPRGTPQAKAVYVAILAGLHKGGAHLLLGTDTPKPGTLPGFSLHEELENFVAAGMTPFEAIRAGTIDPAVFLRQESEFGVIALGRRADLLLLNANPLSDVKNVSNRVGVMANGRWLTEQQLEQQLNHLNATYKH